MANTSRTMASRKRPPPTNGAAANNGSAKPAAVASAGGVAIGGIDALLAKYARHLPPGGTITVQLIKGPTSTSVDPIAARKAAAKAARKAAGNNANASGMSSGNDSDTGAPLAGASAATATSGRKKGITAPLPFPRMAKFNETVTSPDFAKGSLKDGRMYEEEVPKAKDESDEEESTAYASSNIEGDGGDPNNPSISEAAKANKKKKKRWRRHDVRPRRWVVQEKAEFFERIRKRKKRSSNGGGASDDEEQGISNQYHGVEESNASKYVVLSVAPVANPNSSSQVATEQISIQPIYGFHTFSQPHKTQSLSMEEAENAIEQQRNVVTRYMMHGKLSAASQNGGSAEAKAALASGVAVGGRGRGVGTRMLGPAPKAMSRARLLGKLSGGGGGGGGGDDDDDIMADVRYSSSKYSGGGSSRARRELISSMGDEGVTVDDDGVMGGANDSEFGGRRRFARVAANKDSDDTPGKKGGKGGGGGKTSTGFEAGAMEEGFYQRDVAAEYEALDYDANEQFDDDDVNLGEDEMMDDGGGYGGNFDDSGDDNMMDSEDEEGSDDDFQGMATSSGLKTMLAKARGDSPVTVNPEQSSSSFVGAGLDSLDAPPGTREKGLAEEKKPPKQKEKSPKPEPTAVGVEKDKDGKRLITLQAVQREIWLNNGAITSKRLMKKFDVSKKTPERQALFRTIVMELCTMQKDADGANKLVLKQHYSKVSG